MVWSKVANAIHAGCNLIITRFVKRVQMVGAGLVVGYKAATLLLVKGVEQANRRALTPVCKDNAMIKINSVRKQLYQLVCAVAVSGP